MSKKRLAKNEVRVTEYYIGQEPRDVGVIEQGQAKAFYNAIKPSLSIFVLTDAEGKVAGILADPAYLVTALHKSF